MTTKLRNPHAPKRIAFSKRSLSEKIVCFCFFLLFTRRPLLYRRRTIRAIWKPTITPPYRPILPSQATPESDPPRQVNLPPRLKRISETRPMIPPLGRPQRSPTRKACRNAFLLKGGTRFRSPRRYTRIATKEKRSDRLVAPGVPPPIPRAIHPNTLSPPPHPNNKTIPSY